MCLCVRQRVHNGPRRCNSSNAKPQSLVQRMMTTKEHKIVLVLIITNVFSRFGTPIRNPKPWNLKLIKVMRMLIQDDALRAMHVNTVQALALSLLSRSLACMCVRALSLILFLALALPLTFPLPRAFPLPLLEPVFLPLPCTPLLALSLCSLRLFLPKSLTVSLFLSLSCLGHAAPHQAATNPDV